MSEQDWLARLDVRLAVAIDRKGRAGMTGRPWRAAQQEPSYQANYAGCAENYCHVRVESRQRA